MDKEEIQNGLVSIYETLEGFGSEDLEYYNKVINHALDELED